jgi:gas vesicle protein
LVVNNQKDIITKQRVTCDTVGKISENLSMTFQTHREWIKESLEDFKNENRESLKEVIDEFKEGHGGIYKKVEGMDKDMQTSIKEYIKDQGALKIRFNRIYGVMGGIVIAAIGAVATAYSKMIDLHTIIDLLTKIIQHMGIVIK